MKKYRVKVEIRLKPGILDAEGRTIERAIRRFGLDVSNTRKGKIIEFEIEAEDRSTVENKVRNLAENLLINPLTEEFVLEVRGEEA